MTAPASGLRYRMSACRLAGAAGSNARPAAAASISLNDTAGIFLNDAAALAASLSRHAGITGSLRRAAGLSRLLGSTAVAATSTAASTGCGYAATSTACSLGTLCPNVGTLEPGNELPGSGIGQAGRISGFGASAVGASAFSTRSDGQLIHAGRQVLNGPRWSRTGAAAAAALIF